MRKSIFILTLVAMLASLAGCTDEKEEGTVSPIVSEGSIEDKIEGSDDEDWYVESLMDAICGPINDIYAEMIEASEAEGTPDTPREKPIEDSNPHKNIESPVQDNDEIEGN